jgi:hypothetical protein
MLNIQSTNKTKLTAPDSEGNNSPMKKGANALFINALSSAACLQRSSVFSKSKHNGKIIHTRM